MTKCNICKEYYFSDKHYCGTKYEIWTDEEGDSREYGSCYYGQNAENAAEKWAKNYNEDGDYSLMNEEKIVIVLNTETNQEIKVVVSAEPDIYYSSNALDEED